MSERDQTRLPYATEKLDDALEHLVPVMSEAELRAWFEERLAEAVQTYQDFLSRPDSG